MQAGGDYMTVKELIEQLKELPEDAKVMLVSNFGWETNTNEVEEVEFKDNTAKLY